MASDVLCRRPTRSAPVFRPDPSGKSRQARFPERLVKGARFFGARTPSLDERPLPRSGPCPADGLRRRPDTLRPGLFGPVPRSVRTEVAGSSRARHRTHGFAAAGRLPTPLHHPSTRLGG
jgi:hypothetical protein